MLLGPDAINEAFRLPEHVGHQIDQAVTVCDDSTAYLKPRSYSRQPRAVPSHHSPREEPKCPIRGQKNANQENKSESALTKAMSYFNAGGKCAEVITANITNPRYSTTHVQRGRSKAFLPHPINGPV